MKTAFLLRGLCLLISLSLARDLYSLPISNDPAETIPIRIPKKGDVESLDPIARQLAEKLESLFGKPFPIESGDEKSGIVLGTLKEFPQFQADLKRDTPGASEGYLVQSGPRQVLVVGCSPLGVQNACLELLHTLGYRHFFPGKKWEIIPKISSADLSLDTLAFPAFATREIFMGYGLDKAFWEDYADWKRHNRLEYAFALKSGHSYPAIIKRNEEEFRKHPEYLTKPLDQIGRTGKFVIANEGLRKLVIDDSIRFLKENPGVNCLSLDPSDGGGWPESSPLGSTSDQVVTLANDVAKALREAAPGKKIGIYAYNEHSPAPSIEVDRDVIVSVATAFIRGGKSFEELMKDWGKQGAVLGVRDYLSVWQWDNDMPGKSLASSPAKVAARIDLYHTLGARYYIAETGYGWGPHGLGHYVASRALWDTGTKNRVDKIRDDFLSKAFGSASEPMRKFYDLIDGANHPLLSEHLLAEMYRALQSAYATTGDEAVLARIDDLAAYTRFVDLYRKFANAKASERQAAYDEVTQFGARIAKTGMVHVRALFRDPPVRDRNLVLNKERVTQFETKTPGREEFQAIVAKGVEENAPLKFEARAFGDDLVPLSQSDVSGEEPQPQLNLRGKNTFYTYIEKKGEAVEFTLLGGGLPKKTGPVKVRIFPVSHPLGESVADLEIPSDKMAHPVKVFTGFEGLHRIEIDDGGTLSTFSGSAGQPYAIPSGTEGHANLSGRYSLYFFVPKGTLSVAGFVSRPAGKLRDSDGNEIFDFSRLPGSDYFEAPVPSGQDNKVWKLDHCLGYCLLMNVPPYLSPTRKSLLVPKEVVQ